MNNDIYLVPKDELYHYGVKGMKWGVRRALNSASGTALGNMVRTDYEASKMRMRNQKAAHDARSANKRALIEAKHNKKNRKELGLTRKETKAAVKAVKKDIKATNKEIKKTAKQTEKEILQMRKVADAGLTAGERALYRVGRVAIQTAFEKSGTVGQLAVESAIKNFGDQPLTSLEKNFQKGA